MIKCKEDLINTYIENDHGELRDLYIKKAIELGVKTCDGGRFEYLLDKMAIGVRDWGSGAQLEWNNGRFGCVRELTLSDLKPHTRTEYEKVVDCFFDLRDEFERGELVSKVGEQVTEIESEKHFVTQYSFGYIHRKVEKEIDERQEFIERAKDLIDASKDADYSLGNMYDAGCRFQD